jgi:hypothetical protein
MVEKTDHSNVDQKLLSQKTNPKHSVMRHEEEEGMWTTDKKECPKKKNTKKKRNGKEEGWKERRWEKEKGERVGIKPCCNPVLLLLLLELWK